MATEQLNDAKTILNRTPVFDRDKNVWAYELSLHNTAPEADSEEETRLILEEFETQLASDKRILLEFDEHILPENLGQWGIGPRHVLTLPGTVSANPHSLLETAHTVGAKVAASFDALRNTNGGLLEKSDYLRVSIRNKSPREVMSIRKEAEAFNGEILAVDIDSWEAFEGTRALGFHYFQGPFFTKPFFKPGEPVSAAAVAKLQILRELNMPECDMTRLAESIASDVALSYRLLTYINSASFCIAHRIKSIQQAVTLLGLNEIKKWAMVVLMSGMDDTDRGSELAYMALQRARFLESMASLDSVKYTAGTMFMLGLFSKLDALLAHPMEQVLENLPIDDEVKAALTGGDVPLRSWIRMLEAIERDDWKQANDVLESHGACLPHAAANYLKSCSWANRQCSLMRG